MLGAFFSPLYFTVLLLFIHKELFFYLSTCLRKGLLNLTFFTKEKNWC